MGAVVENLGISGSTFTVQALKKNLKDWAVHQDVEVFKDFFG